MRRLISLAVLAVPMLVSSGCGTVGAYGHTTPVLFIQRAVNAQTFNQCTGDPDSLVIYPASGGRFKVGYGNPVWIPMVQQPFAGNGNSIPATAQAFKGGALLGSTSRSFYIDPFSTIRVQWIIGGTSNGGGGQNVFIDYIYGPNGQRIC